LFVTRRRVAAFVAFSKIFSASGGESRRAVAIRRHGSARSHDSVESRSTAERWEMDGRKKAAQTPTASKTENSLVRDFIY
jgi:hypothetical protein